MAKQVSPGVSELCPETQETLLLMAIWVATSALPQRSPHLHRVQPRFLQGETEVQGYEGNCLRSCNVCALAVATVLTAQHPNLCVHLKSVFPPLSLVFPLTAQAEEAIGFSFAMHGLGL